MKLEIKDCKHPWENLQILATSEVRVCCWSTRHLGNLNENTLNELWNGELINDLRDHIKNNKVHFICNKAPCPYIQSYIKN